MPTKGLNFIPRPDAIECLTYQELEAKLRLFDRMLKKCFAHLGEEISRKRLSESAADGTQVLSREVAQALDSLWSNKQIFAQPAAPTAQKGFIPEDDRTQAREARSL